ncbi:hypothetical protein [Cytobacillus praedii]|uniref:hypothetical protein n=1 Tax=Cytobacillus praedii TaxID=1742358 RepID=UPI002E1D1BA2|nr:hypothetical protein [Cytobacillus praedii]
MAKMIQVPYDFSITIPVATAQAVQKKNTEGPISLEALGLLVNLLSYPSTWELHKTELYKRFAKHGERSVKAAWNDLISANYIIEFRYRSGKKYEYVYYFRKVPFTSEEKTEILDTATKEYGEIWGLQNEDPKMKTSKRRGNQKNILNKNTILNTNNINKESIDDDKRTESSAIHNDESINLIISNFRESTKQELTDRSFKAVVRKVMDKYNQGKVNSLRDYLATALANKIDELELRRAKDEAKEKLKVGSQARIQQKTQELEQQPINKKIPFYNWLED